MQVGQVGAALRRGRARVVSPGARKRRWRFHALPNFAALCGDFAHGAKLRDPRDGYSKTAVHKMIAVASLLRLIASRSLVDYTSMRDELAGIREAIRKGRPLTSAQCGALCVAIERLSEMEGWDVEDVAPNAVCRGRFSHRGTRSNTVRRARSADTGATMPKRQH